MPGDRQICAAREALREAQQALDAIAVTGDRTATDAEEDIIAAARLAWEEYLRLVERQFARPPEG